MNESGSNTLLNQLNQCLTISLPLRFSCGSFCFNYKLFDLLMWSMIDCDFIISLIFNFQRQKIRRSDKMTQIVLRIWFDFFSSTFRHRTYIIDDVGTFAQFVFNWKNSHPLESVLLHRNSYDNIFICLSFFLVRLQVNTSNCHFNWRKFYRMFYNWPTLRMKTIKL